MDCYLCPYHLEKDWTLKIDQMLSAKSRAAAGSAGGHVTDLLYHSNLQ